MKLNVLLLGAAMAAFSITAFAGIGAYALKPADATKLSRVADVTDTSIAYVATPAASLSPRAQASQAKIIKGVSADQASTLNCRSAMITTPKSVAECTSHTTMPGCVTVASLK